MIVVAIIAILAAIAIPSFLLLQAKSKQSEARILLNGVYEAEVAYYAEHSEFTGDFSLLNFQPASDPKYYMNWYLNISGEPDHFTATCSANIDKDDEWDIWIITERNREPWNSYNDVKNTPKVYPY
jgi:type II secretory pathway pseudopilin PulG